MSRSAYPFDSSTYELTTCCLLFQMEMFICSEFSNLPVLGSPPCPDYVTPLKKRRLARESVSSEQSFTPPTTPTMLADQQLSSSSPPSQKCVQYDVTCLNMVSVENNILPLLCLACIQLLSFSREVQVLFVANPCDTCGGQRGAVTDFSLSTLACSCQYHSFNDPIVIYSMYH
jgi:hypothetical protein